MKENKMQSIRHEKESQPPGLESMRNTFKKYMRMKVHEVDSDESIIDFRGPHKGNGLDQSHSIPAARLKTVFDSFIGDFKDEAILKDVMVYNHKSLPGLLLVPDLLSPSVQAHLLSCIIHRDLSDPRHQTNLHLFYDIPYPGTQEIPDPERNEVKEDTKSFFSYSPSSSTLFEPKDAAVHKPIGITKVMQKSLRWITLGGQYDWTNKVYHNEKSPDFPTDIGGLLEGLFPETKAQAAIINFYSPGDTLSLHRDVSEECDRPLVSISLGCDGLFIVGLGKDSDASDTAVIRLRSGDAVCMSKESRFAYHAVPKIIGGTCPSYLSHWPAQTGSPHQYEKWRGWMTNKRVNLNVRQMHD